MNTRYFQDTYSGTIIKQVKTVPSPVIWYNWYELRDSKWIHTQSSVTNELIYARIKEITYEEMVLEVL